MLKKFKVYGYFLETAWYCLNIDVDFAHFQKMCFMHFDKKSRRDEVFFIKNTSEFNRQNPFHVSYAACCKDFADFQIDFFIKADSFLLRSFMHFDKKSRPDEVFFIKNISQFNRQNQFHVSYAACCKDFADFQIDFFIKTDSFLLRSLDCRRSSRDRQQQNVDFDYRDLH